MAQPFDYPDANVTCRGALALPGGEGRVPGVAVFHDIGGVGAHTMKWADRIAAELGYLALAADVYGEGKVPADFGEGRQLLGPCLADRARLRARAEAALGALHAHPRCDGRLAAIGFCFGGTTALELARANADGIMAVVSFHGGLSAPLPASTMSARILVCHGAEDPLVAPELSGFLKEMADARADCQTIAYTGAVHSFTNEQADGSQMPGIKYDERTARRSWRAMAAHFAEVFG